MRCSIAQKALGSFQGAFWEDNEIIKHLKEHKKENTLINSYIMKPKAAVKGKGKLGRRGVSNKGSARGSVKTVSSIPRLADWLVNFLL